MKRYFKKYWPMVALVSALVFMVSIPAFAAAGWQTKYERFSATAGESLVTGNVVCISGTDGKAYKADANDAALRPAVGIIGKGGTSGYKVEIVVRGILTGQTAATSGARIFLSETAASMTSTAPTNAQVLGFVLPPETAAATGSAYYINVQLLPASAGGGY